MGLFIILEGEEHVAEEVPKSGDGNGEEFEEVEIVDADTGKTECAAFIGRRPK